MDESRRGWGGRSAQVAVRSLRAGKNCGGAREEFRVPRDLPPYLQELYRTPLLSVAKERALFLKFNFHKYQFVQARRKLEPQFARWRDLAISEGYLRDAIETKNAIVRANLRLVVSDLRLLRLHFFDEGQQALFSSVRRLCDAG